MSGDCWEWTASLNSKGYGRIAVLVDGVWKMRLAHVVAYELFVGPVPVGMELDHTCRNIICCNPAHLEPVTHTENVLRGESPAAHHARKTACVHGHPFTPENTGVRITPTGRSSRVCRACVQARVDRRSAMRAERRRIPV